MQPTYLRRREPFLFFVVFLFFAVFFVFLFFAIGVKKYYKTFKAYNFSADLRRKIA